MNLRALAVVIALGGLWGSFSVASERETPPRAREARQRRIVHTPDRQDKALNDENDPRFALSEQGCLEGRIQDYLLRHGDNGVIDPEVLLELNRETYERMEREKRVRLLSIGGTSWSSLGPTNGAGRMTALATHPTTGGTVLAGAAGGGVWFTTTGGASWSVLSDSIANLSVGAVAYAPSNTSIIYLGTGEGGYAIDFIPGFGLLMSSNGGTSWNLPPSVVASMFYRISVNPSNANELVIGTNNGAQRSTAGQNGPWTQVIARDSAGLTKGYGDVTDLVRDPTNAQVMYAATWDRNYWCARYSCFDPTHFESPTVLKSTDGGATWSPSGSGLPPSTSTLMVNRIALAIAPSSTSTLYAALETYDANTGAVRSHVYKTTNGGGLWTETALSSSGSASIYQYMNGQGWYDNTIVVAPTDANTVVAGGVRYVKTIDGGTTWTTPAFSGDYPHVDAHDLRYDAAGTLYIANDGGVWTSPDSGNNSVNRNANLVTRQFYGLTNDPANRNRVYGGQQDNGTIFRPDAGGTLWNFFTDSDGFQSMLNESDPWVVYSTIQYGGVYRSKKGGNPSPLAISYTPRYGSTESTPFFSLITPDPTNPATLYAASYRLWKSTTGGEAWAPLPTTTTDGSTWSTTSNIRAIAVSRSNPQIIMVAKSTNVFRSTDGGSTWARMITGLPGKTVNSLEIHPTDPNTIFAALAGTSGTSVYSTTNGGTSWNARGTGLPSYSALVVRYDPTDTTTLYCGTDVGVYRSADSGATWSMFGSGLPAVSVYDVKAVSDGAILRAATHGRGVWELNVTGTTNHAPTASITTPASTPQTVTQGSIVTFSGTFSDVDPSDPLTAVWYYPDTWTSTPATSGVSTTHTFNRAGRWPVTLTVTDSHGAKGSANVDIIVPEAGESCASPIVIPGSGPFPYTVTLTTEESTREGSDPTSVGDCYPYLSYNGIWLSFTPAATTTYTISVCGSNVSAVVGGFTGAACGTYTPIGGLCLANYFPSADCSSDTTATFAGTAGTTVRFYVTNYYYQDYGPVSFTITNSSLTSTTPVISSVRPSLGSTAGGTPVIITGSGFAGGATVSFGGTAATGVTVVSSSLITATTGAHAAGTVDASVNSGGTGTLKGAFQYVSSAVSAPASLVAAAVSSSQVNVTWSAVGGADHYELYRSASGLSFTLAGTSVSNSFSDTGRTADTAYLYKARAIGSLGETSADSNVDLATTTIFTDDPLVAGSTAIQAIHLTQMRTAVNAVRILAGIGTGSFTDPSPAGVAIKAVHITELRSALDAARSTLGLAALIYANSLVAGTTPVRAADFTEIRNGTR